MKSLKSLQKQFNKSSVAAIELPEANVVNGNRSRPQSSCSISSAKSRFSSDSAGKRIAQVFGRKISSSLQLALTVLTPIFAVAALCGLTLNGEIGSFKTAQSLSKSIDAANAVGHVVTLLQKERGMSCVLLSTKRYDENAFLYYIQ